MSTINFSYDPEWLDTLSAPFMTNAFIAGLCIALAVLGLNFLGDGLRDVLDPRLNRRG